MNEAKPKFDRESKLVLVAFALAFLLRVLLSAKIGLGDDEAYYWDWSRHLSLSYFDHPGMTAWLIRLGTALFGDTPIGVRIFGLLCNAGSGLLLWRLTRELFGSQEAVLAGLLYLLAPGFSVGGMLMVPDAPMGFFWMLTLFFTWRALNGASDSHRIWGAAGLSLGLGLLSKYTIIVLALSIIVLISVSPEWRRHLRGQGFRLAIAVGLMVSLPLMIWNAQHDWVTVKFHIHDRQVGGGGANLTRWSQFWVSQAILVTPAVFIASMGALAVAVARFKDLRWRFLFFLSTPVFALFATQALFAEFKPHWPLPAYILAFAGIGRLWVEGFGMRSIRATGFTRGAFATLAMVFLIPINTIFHVGTVRPVISKIGREQIAALKLPVSWDPKFDPTNDLYGWDAVAQRINALRDRERLLGRPTPFLASWRYQLVAQLAFATGEEVLRTGGGRDEYMIDQGKTMKSRLRGRPAFYVTDNRFDRDPMEEHDFASCFEEPPVRVYREKEFARTFRIWRCENYRGSGEGGIGDVVGVGVGD